MIRRILGHPSLGVKWALYLGFSIGVYLLQGAHPTVNIDHVVYIRSTRTIIGLHPNHDYWRSISALSTLPVILAYLYSVTGDYIQALKDFLVLITLCYLPAAEYFFGRFTKVKAVAVVGALASAVHLSFGTVFWGFTDFSASLGRSLPVPLFMVLLGLYFENWNKLRRYFAYPTLVALSILHLGTFYLLGVLVLMDTVRLLHSIKVRRSAIVRDMGWFGLAFLSTFAVNSALNHSGLGATSLRVVAPQVNAPRSSAPAPVVAAAPAPRPSAVFYEDLPRWTRDLSSADSWSLEIANQPWRNFPPSASTILGFVASGGLLLCVTLLSARAAIVRFGLQEADRRMFLFSAAIVVCSYTLQVLLWVARHFWGVYPINFEEVRTLAFLALPMYYFCLRGLEVWYFGAGENERNLWMILLILFALFVRPLVIVRSLPVTVREGIVNFAENENILHREETQRVMYARQLLNLETSEERYFYSVQPLIGWFNARVSPKDRILTNREDLRIVDATILGDSNSFLDTSSASLRRRVLWSIRNRFEAALSSRDLNAVVEIGRECHATYAVVPWDVPGASFKSGIFSVIQFQK